MSQKKWVLTMLMIVIVALGVLVVLLLYDGADAPIPSPTATSTIAPADTPPEVTQAPEQPQLTAAPAAVASSYVFQIYDDVPRHYGDIAYMGSQNNGDDGSMTIDPECADRPHSGGSFIRITYNPPYAGHWVGMMWLSGASNYPPNLPVDGVDAAQASQLTFYARGSGSTKFFIENDKKQQVTLHAELTQDWTKYTLAVPADWEQICVGFGFASNGAAGACVIDLDDIAYSNEVS